ncbi:MAG: response regulator [Oligoflexales bacterium]
MSDLPGILIVDDEVDLGEILADYLEDDFECTVCSNPVNAIKLIKENTYDLVISDMHMPNVNGFEIIELVKKVQPDTPIILLTGNSKNDPIVQEAIAKGASGIITKPFNSPDEVLEYLKKFI